MHDLFFEPSEGRRWRVVGRLTAATGVLGGLRFVFRGAVCDEKRSVFRHQYRWDKWKFCVFVPKNDIFGTKTAVFATLAKLIAHFGFWDEKWVYFCIRKQQKRLYYEIDNDRKTDPHV